MKDSICNTCKQHVKPLTPPMYPVRDECMSGQKVEDGKQACDKWTWGAKCHCGYGDCPICYPW